MSGTEGTPRADTVSELLTVTRRLIDDERTRGQGLDSKTSSLAGFTGAILAITVALGHDVGRLHLGRVGNDVASGMYIVAVVALACAAVLAVLGGLRPQQRLAISMTEIRSFAQYPLIAVEPMEIHGRMMNTLVEAIDYERQANDRKARFARRAAVALVVGFLASGAEAVTVVLAS
jgi:hypothetical protein